MPKIHIQYVSDTRDASEFFTCVEDAKYWLDTISEEDEADTEVEDECEDDYQPYVRPKKVSLSFKYGYEKTKSELIKEGYVKTYTGKTGETWELL